MTILLAKPLFKSNNIIIINNDDDNDIKDNIMIIIGNFTASFAAEKCACHQTIIIKRINVETKEIKIMQYADDTTVFLTFRIERRYKNCKIYCNLQDYNKSFEI